MTIDAFRQNDLLSATLADLLQNNETLKMALAVCDAASPANGGVKDWKESHLAHIQLGVDRGYNLYPQILRMLATKPTKTEPVEPTYEEPELAIEK